VVTGSALKPEVMSTAEARVEFWKEGTWIKVVKGVMEWEQLNWQVNWQFGFIFYKSKDAAGRYLF